MDKSTASGAHPAFVEVIKQLTPDEAKLVALFAQDRPFPMLDLRWEHKPGLASGKTGGQDVLVNYSFLGRDAGCEFRELTPAYIDNLCRLGLCEVPPLFKFTGDGVYSELEASPEVLAMKELIERKNPDVIVRLNRKGMRVTQLGRQFIRACVIPKN